MKKLRNIYVALFIGLIILSLQSTGRAQVLAYSPPDSLGTGTAKIGREILSIAAIVGRDVLHVFSSPLHLKPKGGVKCLALTALATASVVWLDKDIDDDFSEREDFLIKPAIGLAKIGESYDQVISNKYLLAGLGIPMIAGGLIFKDDKALQTTRLMVESFIITGKITAFAKGVFGRARPYTGEGPQNFTWFKFNAKQGRRSLPSGHVSSAFSIVTILAKQYDTWWVEIPAYTVGVAVACQRMESRSHWNADVIAGGALGYWVGSTLVNRYKQTSKSLSVNPYLLGNRVGLIVEF